jgi:(E)-4-hydroxy-3-methylbut-2-enyl-diphosphate synthase
VYCSNQISIGNVDIGGTNPVCIQSMTTTNTMDVEATVKQVLELVSAGCDIVRLTTRNKKEAGNLKLIKQALLDCGIEVPLIADVHYHPEVAEVAAKYVDKVRINPGNYIDKKTSSDINISNEKISEVISGNLLPLINNCIKYNTAIRIGVNHGSLSERILHKYGNTSLGMVESLMEFVDVFKRQNFSNLVLSIKASDVFTMIETNLLLVKRLNQEGVGYPLHIGVTEAGNGMEGRVSSSLGIGYLLSNGIGDTIRVSLTENPVNEIPVAKKLVKYFKHDNYNEGLLNISWRFIPKVMLSGKKPIVFTKGISDMSDYSLRDFSNTDKSTEDCHRIALITYNSIEYDDLIIRASGDIASLIIDYKADGICIDNIGATNDDQNVTILLEILQSLNLRITNTRFVACPTCGRSTFNTEKVLSEVKQITSGLPGLKIGIMGCSVNGPGEMKGVDYGIVGSGNNKVDIYKNGIIVEKSIPEDMATGTLLSVMNIDSDGNGSN